MMEHSAYLAAVADWLRARGMTVNAPELESSGDDGPSGTIRIVDALWYCPWNISDPDEQVVEEYPEVHWSARRGWWLRWVLVEPPGRIPRDQSAIYGPVVGLDQVVPPARQAADAVAFAITDLRGWVKHHERSWEPNPHPHLPRYEDTDLTDLHTAATS